MSNERRLPDFDEPPVIETVLGVEFAPLEKWSIPHFGLFWARIKDDYPHHQALPPISSRIEKFGAETKQPQPPKLELVSEISVRCWFVNTPKTRLIQVQNDRFVHNWRKTAQTEIGRASCRERV